MAWGFQSTDLPADVLLTNSAVTVTDDGEAIHFEPRSGKRANGVIFLPGGMVDPLAYTPLCKALASAGHPVYLVRLPMRIAFTEAQVDGLFSRVTALITAHRETRWFLSGHSRGAMLSTRYARESQTAIDGLVLIATTHPRDFDLSATNLRVTKIFGAADGIAGPDAIRQNAKLLPPSTTWVEIPGANHVQFAYYRYQLGAGAATISRDKQQARLLEAMRAAISESSK